MADRRGELVNRRSVVTVSGASLIAPLIQSGVQESSQNLAALSAADRAVAESAAAQAAAQYQDMLDIQASGDNAAAIAARAKRNGDNLTSSDADEFLVALKYSPDLASLLASSRRYAEGDTIQTRAEGFTYTVASGAATDHHLSTTGGVKLYVAPPAGGSIPIGAFGAKGDGETDDSRAFTKAINAFPELASFDILCEGLTYKIRSAAIYFTRGIRIVGRSRQDNHTVLDFSDSTTVVNAPYNAHIISVHSGNITGSSLHADSIRLPARQIGTYGEGSGLEDLQVKCNPDIVGGIGVFANVAMDCTRVLVRDANLHCWAIVGHATNMLTRGGTVGPSGLNIGGNSNNGVYTQIWGRHAVNGDGIHCSGADANQNLFNHADMAGCKGWGVNDASFLGNVWNAPHTADNAYGAYRTPTASASGSVFIGPYAEASQGTDNGGVFYEMNTRAVVIGPTGEAPVGVLPMLSGQLVGMQISTELWLMEAPDSYSGTDPYTRIGFGLFRMRTTDGKAIGFQREGPTYTALAHDGQTPVLFPNTEIGAVRPDRPFFPNGLALDANHAQTAAAAAPTTGAHVVGEFVWNKAPGKDANDMILLGWTCTAAGTPGTFEPCYVSAVSPAS